MKRNRFLKSSLNKAIYIIVLFVTVQGLKSQEKTQNDKNYYIDIYPDTWVATDGINRKMPDCDSVGMPKTDQRRIVGIFYITWHTQGLANMKKPYEADVSKILQKDPNARLEANNPLWTEGSYHWGEPEMGYFLSQDEYVIRKDMSMLSDAGVDVLVMDVTNAVRYWDEWEFMFAIMQKMKQEGNKVPQFVFWAFNGPVITVVQDLYDSIYKKEKFKDLWFYWDGKPLLLYNGTPTFDANQNNLKHPNPHYDEKAKNDLNHPHYNDPDYVNEFYQDYTAEVKNFFTLRTMWWGYYEWGGKRFIGTEDNWSFGYSMADPNVKSLKPEKLLSTHKGKREQAAVTTAQHPVTMTKENMGVGKSWSRKYGQPHLNQYDLPDSAFVPWLNKFVQHPEGYGIYFQERWDEAIESNPEFLYINDWNEWTAGKYQPENDKTTPWLGRENTFFFVDQYNAEFNRGIQPMKGGYNDNYYMQMAQNIRRYKGVRPTPKQKGFSVITINGDFNDWKSIANEYRDTKGDTFHRDAIGYAGTRYTNQSGRNDILVSKIAVDKKNIYFYAKTDKKLTPHTNKNWMLLLIDADNNSETGWFGYDFLINQKIKNEEITSIHRYNGTTWEEISDIPYSYSGNQLEIAIPKKLLKLLNAPFVIDFKWSDNVDALINPISFCTHGDTAPNRRFNYRCIWEK
ncbi:MAG: hypothetical protein PHG27_03610 [Massilibacteroides sp.]|nr:hypothetical protein [Massilibacteroides sp.]MDD3061884.1 hypothetical protein [Massilibacteroides sp.]MDD4114674.1 hypothetical protein [Massilibacteroides sp.]MDD4660659.1 hypothetical protein [Massilibacteroides sp.]